MTRFQSMRSVVAAVLAAAVLLNGVAARAQTAVHHGTLTIRSARGVIDRQSGIATLRVNNWDLLLAPDSNGIVPDREPVLVAIGDSERLVVPAGQLRASRSGKVFTYRNPKTPRGIRFFQMRELRNNAGAKARYRVRFSLIGIDFSSLVISYPDCKSLAVIVGDDDGFEGIEITRPGEPQFCCRKVKVTGACQAQEWPWA